LNYLYEATGGLPRENSKTPKIFKRRVTKSKEWTVFKCTLFYGSQCVLLKSKRKIEKVGTTSERTDKKIGRIFLRNW